MLLWLNRIFDVFFTIFSNESLDFVWFHVAHFWIAHLHNAVQRNAIYNIIIVRFVTYFMGVCVCAVCNWVCTHYYVNYYAAWHIRCAFDRFFVVRKSGSREHMRCDLNLLFAQCTRSHMGFFTFHCVPNSVQISIVLCIAGLIRNRLPR